MTMTWRVLMLALALGLLGLLVAIWRTTVVP